MNYAQTQAFANDLRDEIRRTPTLHGLVEVSEIEEAGRLRLLITHGNDFHRFVTKSLSE